MTPFIKICGVTQLEDAEFVVAAGATAIGFNLWAKSPRFVSLDAARAITEVIGDRIETVAVVVDADERFIEQVVQILRPRRIQFHGKVTERAWQMAPEGSYTAVGLGEDADVARALKSHGSWVLVDTKDLLRHGGTGVVPPLSLATQVARGKSTILAGGLTPDNVERIIREVRPMGVDTASGVEDAPGRKSRNKVHEFVHAARRAFQAVEK